MRLNLGKGIIFARTASNHPWPHYAAAGRGRYAGGGISNPSSSLHILSQYGYDLMSYANAEEARERDILRQAGIDLNSLSTEQFIKEYNKLMKNATRIKEALSKAEAACVKSGASINSFDDRLAKNLARRINQFANLNAVDINQNNFSAWDRSIEDIVDKAIKSAFTGVLKHEGSTPEESAALKEILNVTRQIKGFDKYFSGIVKQKLNIENLRNIFLQDGVQIREGQRNVGVKKFIDSASGLNLASQRGQRTTSLGNSVQEAAILALQKTGLGNIHVVITPSGSSVSMPAVHDLGGLPIYSYTKTVDPDMVARNVEMPSMGLPQVISSLRQVYDDFLSKLQNVIIYTGVNGVLPFTGTISENGSEPLTAAPGFLAQVGIGCSYEQIKLVYQTAAGAFRAGDASLIEPLKDGLLMAVAKMVFDKVQVQGLPTIGGGNIRAIRLGGKLVPGSAVIRAAGRAFVDAAMNFYQRGNVEINIPAVDTSRIDGTIIDQLYAQWYDRFDSVEAGSYFSYHFSLSFGSTIASYL